MGQERLRESPAEAQEDGGPQGFGAADILHKPPHIAVLRRRKVQPLCSRLYLETPPPPGSAGPDVQQEADCQAGPVRLQVTTQIACHIQCWQCRYLIPLRPKLPDMEPRQQREKQRWRASVANQKSAAASLEANRSPTGVAVGEQPHQLGFSILDKSPIIHHRSTNYFCRAASRALAGKRQLDGGHQPPAGLELGWNRTQKHKRA